MLESVMDESGEKVIIKVSGDLTVRNVGELYRKLNELLETASEVELQLVDVEEADMTFFQLICSAHRSYSQNNKLLTVTGARNELYDKNKINGFIRHKGCSMDRFGNCVLMKEK